VLTALAQDPPKSDSPPLVDISVKTLKNPNEHIFITKNHNENKFNYRKIQIDDKSRQPVLFEHLMTMHLTRSKYIITSYLDFNQYYDGFTHLEDFANKLLLEVTKLAQTEMPYFIQRDGKQRVILDDIFKTHKREVINLIQTLEAHKLQFNKILDHIATSTNKDPNGKAHRVKRGAIQSIFKWLFGSDDNSETINQIKKNIEILEQNQQTLGNELMRQMEAIAESNGQISRNRAVLNTLNRDLVQLNHSMNTVSEGLKVLEFSKNFLLAMLQVRNRLATMRDGLDNLSLDLIKIHQYMLSLTTHKVTPNLIPPTDLRSILSSVEEKLRMNPKLSLPISQKADIWSYYQFLKINAFVHQDMLIVILILPLIDKDLEFNLFKAHSLPLLHPELKKVFSYEIKNPYIAIRSDGSYLTIPLHDDILTCTISAGHFCNLNTPLYPTKSTKECVYHLLMNDKGNIKEYCKINIENYMQDTAINLEQNIWALAVLEPTELHVSCLTNSYQIRVNTVVLLWTASLIMT